jgi:hypothetical protein
VRWPLGREYDYLTNSLWFPPSAIKTPRKEISVYDGEITEVPRAVGGTCPSYGFMLAYNQFSKGASDSDLKTYASSTTTSLPVGYAGGLGRKGAQKLIIMQTDGVPSTALFDSSAGDGGVKSMFTDNGSYKSFFNVRIKDPSVLNNQTGTNNTAAGQNANFGNEVPPQMTGIAIGAAYPTNADQNTFDVVQLLCAPDKAKGGARFGGLGFSTDKKPVKVHCIAFGSLFESGKSGTALTDQQRALSVLQKIQYLGGVQPSETTPLPDYKMITGTADERIQKLQKAIGTIMQDGYSVTLIE